MMKANFRISGKSQLSLVKCTVTYKSLKAHAMRKWVSYLWNYHHLSFYHSKE